MERKAEIESSLPEKTAQLKINDVKEECFKQISLLKQLKQYEATHKETILFQRCFLKTAEDLGEALTYFRAENPLLKNIQSTNIPEKFAKHRNQLKHHYLYQKWEGKSNLFESAYKDIMVTHLDELEKELNRIKAPAQTKCTKILKKPPVDVHNYSVIDYLNVLENEINELEKLLEYYQSDLHTDEKLFVMPSISNCLESIDHILIDLKTRTDKGQIKFSKNFISLMKEVEEKFAKNYIEFFPQLKKRRADLSHSTGKILPLHKLIETAKIACALKENYLNPLRSFLTKKKKDIPHTITLKNITDKSVWIKTSSLLKEKSSKTSKQPTHIRFKYPSSSSSEDEEKTTKIERTHFSMEQIYELNEDSSKEDPTASSKRKLLTESTDSSIEEELLTKTKQIKSTPESSSMNVRLQTAPISQVQPLKHSSTTRVTQRLYIKGRKQLTQSFKKNSKIGERISRFSFKKYSFPVSLFKLKMKKNATYTSPTQKFAILTRNRDNI